MGTVTGAGKSTTYPGEPLLYGQCSDKYALFPMDSRGDAPAMPAEEPKDATSELRVHLLGPFRALRDGQPVPLPRGSCRVLAYLALHGTASRGEVAADLWPEATPARASSDLRTALWRLQSADVGFMYSEGQTLALCATVVVDAHQVAEWAMAVLAAPVTTFEPPPVPPGSERELLPGWDEEWLDHHRERARLLTVQAFESAGERLLANGRTAEALPYLLRVTQLDPFRESAQQLLLQLHLRQRNVHEALRQYRRYRELVRRDLGMEPSAGLRALLSGYLPDLPGD